MEVLKHISSRMGTVHFNIGLATMLGVPCKHLRFQLLLEYIAATGFSRSAGTCNMN